MRSGKKYRVNDIWELKKGYAEKVGGNFAKILEVKRRGKDQIVDLLIINNNSTFVEESVKVLKRLAKNHK